MWHHQIFFQLSRHRICSLGQCWGDHLLRSDAWWTTVLAQQEKQRESQAEPNDKLHHFFFCFLALILNSSWKGHHFLFDKLLKKWVMSFDHISVAWPACRCLGVMSCPSPWAPSSMRPLPGKATLENVKNVFFWKKVGWFCVTPGQKESHIIIVHIQ